MYMYIHTYLRMYIYINTHHTILISAHPSEPPAVGTRSLCRVPHTLPSLQTSVTRSYRTKFYIYRYYRWLQMTTDYDSMSCTYPLLPLKLNPCRHLWRASLKPCRQPRNRDRHVVVPLALSVETREVHKPQDPALTFHEKENHRMRCRLRQWKWRRSRWRWWYLNDRSKEMKSKPHIDFVWLYHGNNFLWDNE